jgi:hypothetical protein
MPTTMPKSWIAAAVLVLILASNALFLNSASAEFFGCNDRHAARSWSAPRAQAFTHEFAAQSQARARVTIHPRHLSPNAKRHCEAWLAKEYRVSGTVIVPRERCWWQ